MSQVMGFLIELTVPSTMGVMDAKKELKSSIQFGSAEVSFLYCDEGRVDDQAGRPVNE